MSESPDRNRLSLHGAALREIDREIEDCERGQPYRLALLAVFREGLTIGDLEAICHSMQIHIEQMSGDKTVAATAIVNECERIIAQSRAWLERSPTSTRESRLAVEREITLQNQMRLRWIRHLIPSSDGSAP